MYDERTTSADSLIEKLEAATEGSVELDRAVCSAVFANSACADCVGLCLFTTSIDAALTLVPEGLCWRYDSALGYAEIFDLSRSPVFVAGSSDDPCLPTHAAIPALAICIAALKARQQET